MFSPRSLLTSLLLVACVTVSGQASAADATFASVVKTHYAEWTKGIPDKKLSAERVAALVNNPKVRGDEAMAIAAVHYFFKGKNAPRAVGENFLLDKSDVDLRKREEKESAQAFLANLVKTVKEQEAAQANFEANVVRWIQQAESRRREHDFQGNFVRYVAHLKSVPRTLFAKGAPRRQGIQQGATSDGYLLDAVGALVTFHPDQVKSMIRQEKDGSCTVTFPGRLPVKVPPLTDAQIVLGDSAGQQGLWLNVMAEAYALDRKRPGGPAVVLDDLGFGSCVPIIALLTGQKESQIKHILPRVRAARDKAATEKAVEKMLLPVHDQKVIACASTAAKEVEFLRLGRFKQLLGAKSEDNWGKAHVKRFDQESLPAGCLPPGIGGGHCYAVIGYDPVKKLVTLWDPTGGNWDPVAEFEFPNSHPIEPGLRNGYRREGGVFAMPLSDFVVVFHGFEVQDSGPIGAKK